MILKKIRNHAKIPGNTFFGAGSTHFLETLFLDPDIQGEASEDGCIKEVVHSLINAKGTSSSQLQLAINSSLILSC